MQLPQKTILVIEDEFLIRQYIVETLKLNQFLTLDAEDGALGLTLARRFRPDLILCDVRMPHVDGYDVLAEIRQDPDLATIPFIFLTARASHDDVRHGMNLGADDYLVKPCRSRDLIAAIESTIRKHEVMNRNHLKQVRDFKVQIAQIAQIAHWDMMTDLPNRSSFQEHLRTLCNRSDSGIGAISSVAMLSIKVTSYRSVCLTLGQESGDRFLKLLADRLMIAASPGFVGRLSEDVFGVVLENAGNSVEISEFTQTLLRILNMPYPLFEQNLRLQCHVGISVYPQHGLNIDVLILQSNVAMTWCCAQVTAGFRFYNPAIANLEAERHLMTTDLAAAIERSQLELYYQPQMDLATGALTGVEALARWNDLKRGVVSPKSFIGVAEESGLIVPLGEWALRSGCQQLMAWSEHLTVPITIAVNLSMRQFQCPKLVDLVKTVLEETGLDPGLLVLELTESCVMENLDATVQKLLQLKRLGVKLAVDDFGTGYSSLSYLGQLPIDELKIDQSFVRQINCDRNAMLISRSIISMARSLELRIVAEGIENQEQLDFLKNAGCHVGQGFFYSKPLTSAAMTRWFSRSQGVLC
ncbi:MAG: EAL domain-containing protein [Alkalinema sp. CAN_BIN05]|nr:EAL domain-containing protein [Alkalinema sp. CAN_BIN05]